MIAEHAVPRPLPPVAPAPRGQLLASKPGNPASLNPMRPNPCNTMSCLKVLRQLSNQFHNIDCKLYQSSFEVVCADIPPNAHTGMGLEQIRFHETVI